jgi:hypothetical protein
MKSLRFRPLLLAAAIACPALAHAHPGHDGDHGLVWDFDHLAAHPLATILCFTVLTVGAWNLGLFLRSRRAKARSIAIKSDSQR